MGVKNYIEEGIEEIDDNKDEPISERKIVKEPPSPAPIGEKTPGKPLET